MTDSLRGRRARRLWFAHPDHRNVQRRARHSSSSGARSQVRSGYRGGALERERRPLLERVLSCDPAKLTRLAPSVRNRLLAHAYAAAGYGRFD